MMFTFLKLYEMIGKWNTPGTEVLVRKGWQGYPPTLNMGCNGRSRIVE